MIVLDKRYNICIEERLEIKQLRWFEHLMRMREDRKLRQIVKTWPEGRRIRGRSRKICKDGIYEIGKNGTLLAELRKIVDNRKDRMRWI